MDDIFAMYPTASANNLISGMLVKKIGHSHSACSLVPCLLFNLIYYGFYFSYLYIVFTGDRKLNMNFMNIYYFAIEPYCTSITRYVVLMDYAIYKRIITVSRGTLIFCLMAN